jgi:hypothetical protein
MYIMISRRRRRKTRRIQLRVRSMMIQQYYHHHYYFFISQKLPVQPLNMRRAVYNHIYHGDHVVLLIYQNGLYVIIPKIPNHVRPFFLYIFILSFLSYVAHNFFPFRLFFIFIKGHNILDGGIYRYNYSQLPTVIHIKMQNCLV